MYKSLNLSILQEQRSRDEGREVVVAPNAAVGGPVIVSVFLLYYFKFNVFILFGYIKYFSFKFTELLYAIIGQPPLPHDDSGRCL